jgi:hypothetical protein
VDYVDLPPSTKKIFSTTTKRKIIKSFVRLGAVVSGHTGGAVTSCSSFGEAMAGIPGGVLIKPVLWD